MFTADGIANIYRIWCLRLLLHALVPCSHDQLCDQYYLSHFQVQIRVEGSKEQSFTKASKSPFLPLTISTIWLNITASLIDRETVRNTTCVPSPSTHEDHDAILTWEGSRHVQL